MIRHEQNQDPEAEAAKLNAAITNFIINIGTRPIAILQNVSVNTFLNSITGVFKRFVYKKSAYGKSCDRWRGTPLIFISRSVYS